MLCNYILARVIGRNVGSCLKMTYSCFVISTSCLVSLGELCQQLWFTSDCHVIYCVDNVCLLSRRETKRSACSGVFVYTFCLVWIKGWTYNL